MTYVLFILYFFVGYIVYRAKYPVGFMPDEPDDELQRLRRLGRRRVLPLPERDGEP